MNIPTDNNRFLSDEWRDGLDHLHRNEPLPGDLFVRLTTAAKRPIDAQTLAAFAELVILFREWRLPIDLAEAVFEIPEEKRVAAGLNKYTQFAIEAGKATSARQEALRNFVRASLPGALLYPYPVPPESPVVEPDLSGSSLAESINADISILLWQSAKLAVSIVSNLNPSLEVARLYRDLPVCMDTKVPQGLELRRLVREVEKEENRHEVETRLQQDPGNLAVLLDAVGLYAHQEEKLCEVHKKILWALKFQSASDVVRAFHRSSFELYIDQMEVRERERMTLTDPATREELDLPAEVFEELHARGMYDRKLAKVAGRYFCLILNEAESCPYEFLWGCAEHVLDCDFEIPLAVEYWLLAAERAFKEDSLHRAQGAFAWAIAGRTLQLYAYSCLGDLADRPAPLRIQWAQLVRSVVELGNYPEVGNFLLRMRECVKGQGQPGGLCQQFDLDLTEAIRRIETEARRHQVPVSFGEAKFQHQESVMEAIGPDLWVQLHAKTQGFLVQAEFFYRFGVATSIPHWGPVAINYFNALEKEVVEKGPRRWGALFLANIRWQPPLPQFLKFLEEARKGTFGGSYMKLLEQNVSEPETLLNILPEMRSLYARLRNPAAHAGESSRENIEELRKRFSAGEHCAKFLRALQPPVTK